MLPSTWLIFCSSHFASDMLAGDAERVEMVIDDVVVEVSKHRGIGRMYLTNFRWALFAVFCIHVKCVNIYCIFLITAVLHKFTCWLLNLFVFHLLCRLVILCHLSGLTAAGYTYVSIYHVAGKSCES